MMDKYDHIDNKTIESGIYETELEIVQMEREIQGLKLLGDRMSLFRASAREIGITERHKFISKLRNILTDRSKANV